MIGYAENLDISLEIRSIPSHLASILQFLVQPFWIHYFKVQTYVQSICHSECLMIFLKVFQSICQHFDRIASQ